MQWRDQQGSEAGSDRVCLSRSKGTGVAGGERVGWAEPKRGGDAGPAMQGTLEAVLAPNLWLTKRKLLEGSVQRSDVTGLSW